MSTQHVKWNEHPSWRYTNNKAKAADQAWVLASLAYWLPILKANRRDRIARFNVKWFMEWAHQNANLSPADK